MRNILNFLVISTYIFIYFIPMRGPSFDKVIFIYYGVLILSTLMIMFQSFKMNLKTYYIFLVFITLITYRVFVMKDIESLNILFTLYIALVVTSYDYEINNKLIERLTYLSLLAIVAQMIIFRNLGRPVLSIIDPNYSGFFIFLVFVSLDKMNSKLRYFAIILGLLTLSRSFMLALIVHYVFKNKKVVNLVYKFKLSSFYSLAFLSCFILVFFSYYFVNNVQVVAQPYSISRVYKFNDPSNMSRFNANIRFFEALVNDNKFLLLGEKDIEVYKVNYYRNVPHNNFFEGIRRYGLLLYFFMFYLTGKSYNKVVSKNNIHIVIALFSYYTFLGGLTYGYRLLLMLIILKFTYAGTDYSVIELKEV